MNNDGLVIGSFETDKLRRREDYLDWVLALKPGDPVVLQGALGLEIFATITETTPNCITASHPQCGGEWTSSIYGMAGMNGYFILAPVQHLVIFDTIHGPYISPYRRKP